MADSSWLTALPVSGSGDLSVSVGGSLWTGRLDRSGQLTVSGVTFPDLSCVLNCTQAGSVILESTGESSATVGAKVGGYVALQGVSIRSNLESLTFSFVGSGGGSDWVSGVRYSVDGGDTMLDSGESIPGDPGATGVYTVGVYVSVAEETSGVSRSGVLTVSGSGQTLEFTISQSAGVKTYGPVEILSLTAADVPASGGSVTSGSVSYRQTYGWNGATSGAGTITSGGSVSWSGGASGIGSLGTTVKDRSVVGSPLVVTVALNDQVGSSSVDIYQAANVSTLTGISADTLSYDAIPVLGGSSSPYYSISGSYSYTSGSTSTSVIDSVVRSRMRAATAATKSFAFVAPVAGFTIDSGTGVVSATETEQSSEKVAQVKMSVEYEGFSSSVTGTCLQPAGSVVYGTPAVALSYATAPAAGGTLRPVFSVTQPWGWNNDTDAGELSYDLESLPDGSSVNFTTTAGTVGSKDGSIAVLTKGTTESGVTTYATITCAVAVNGVSGSGTAAVSQAANTKALTAVSIERNGAIVTSFTAAGGTANYKPVGVYTYTSTSTQTVELSSEVAKDNWSLDQAWGSVAANPTYPWCSVVTINSRGTAIGNSQSAVLKLTVGGLSDSVTLTQAGNYVTGLSLSGGTFTYDTVWASGNSQIWPQQKSHVCTFTYSSGSQTTATPSSTYGTYSFVVTYSLNSNKNGFSLVNPSNGILSVPSRGTTIGDAITSDVVTLKGVVTWTPNSNYNTEGTKTNTLLTTATCTQEANEQKQTACSIEINHDYQDPLGYNNTNVPAAGGRVCIVGVRHYSYTSGATSQIEYDSFTLNCNQSWCVSDDASNLTISSRGTVTGSDRSATVYWQDGSCKSNEMTITQKANQEASYSIYGGVGSKTPTGGANDWMSVGGGTFTFFTQLKVTYSSGSTEERSVTQNTEYVMDSGGYATVTGNKATIPGRGITIGNARYCGFTQCYSIGGKTYTSWFNTAQNGNYVESIKGSVGTFSYPTIGAGATSATPDLSAGFGILFTFSSGSTSSSAPASTYGTLSVPSSFKLSASQNGFTAVNASTGVLTATNRGTTIGDARTSGTVTRTLTATWTPTSSYNTAGTKTSTWSTTATCTQAANTLTWNTPTISRTTPVTIAAVGGTDNVATGLTYSQTGQYSSGSPASANSGGILSYAVKTAKTGFSLSGSTVTATNNTSTSARNGFVVQITLVLHELIATKEITYNQAAGYFTYANPVINATYPTIPASGGTVTPTVSYSQTYGWNGATSGAGTDTTGGSISYAGSSVNTSNGSVTAGSKGTVASGVTDVTTATITVTMHGKRSDKQVKVQQAANSIERYNYGNYTASLSLNSTAALAAGATTRTVTWGYIRRSKTPVYSSGAPGSASTETWSGTAYLTVSVNSGASYCSVNPASYTNSSSTTSSTLTKTTYGTTVISAQTYTLQVRQGSASGTVVASTSVPSNANAVTNSNYNPRITTYGTPTVSIGSGMTAAGGSATVSHSVSNTQTYNALYTSGATGPNQTRSVAGTSTISITSNGNSAFSLSGNTLFHRDMTTTLATDSVTITAQNSGDTSKTKTASTSITNSRKATSSSGGVITYGNVIAGTITNQTIPAAGGSATATAGNGSQSWNKTAVVTTYTYDSGDTQQETTTAASSGNNTISPSVSSITASASSKGRTVSGQTTVKSQTVIWSGSAGKSASGTLYIYQAANSVKSYSNILINQFGYDNIPYSGGFDSPVMDITYDVTYDSGTYRDEHGLPSGYSISYSISGSGFSINASSGVVTAQANATTSTRSATVTATVKNSSGTSVTSATTKITQAAKPGPVDIYITTSFNYATSLIQINFSSAPKDAFFIKFMGYDQFGSIWESVTGFTPSSETSFTYAPPGYSITDQFSIEGIGSSEYTISPSSPYETSNARYYWSSEMITIV